MSKDIEYRDNNGNAFMGAPLLMCPCCGSEPILIFNGNNYTKSRSVTIKCQKCRLQRTDGVMRFDHEWCAKVSIEHWNHRQD